VWVRGVVNFFDSCQLSRVQDKRLDIREGVVRFPRKRIMGWRRRARVAFIVRCDVKVACDAKWAIAEAQSIQALIHLWKLTKDRKRVVWYQKGAKRGRS
jgi:hypothetical protein